MEFTHSVKIKDIFNKTPNDIIIAALKRISEIYNFEVIFFVFFLIKLILLIRLMNLQMIFFYKLLVNAFLLCQMKKKILHSFKLLIIFL